VRVADRSSAPAGGREYADLNAQVADEEGTLTLKSRSGLPLLPLPADIKERCVRHPVRFPLLSPAFLCPPLSSRFPPELRLCTRSRLWLNHYLPYASAGVTISSAACGSPAAGPYQTLPPKVVM